MPNRPDLHFYTGVYETDHYSLHFHLWLKETASFFNFTFILWGGWWLIIIIITISEQILLHMNIRMRLSIKEHNLCS
jgi:hypothetical protein